ncbi:hypothetical protein [Xanthomonas sp. 3075]|uniref:hypothetical protein n=1 Tax=Xanthomonas sp. 3075 TaxID=3035315 RepID=UPI00160C56D5|nr:hypothetical protein [Xanthomonas sp. 3075]
MKRVAAEVHDLQDTLKVALDNGDLYVTTPHHLTKAEANTHNNKTFSEYEQYRADHAQQLKTLRAMNDVESEWAAITRSEQRITAVIQAKQRTSTNLVGVPGEPDVVARETAGRDEFRLAIAHAKDAGRVRLSESNAALIQQVLDDTPTISTAARSIPQVAGAAPYPYTPLSQRGFTTAELLAGDLSAGQALRSAGLLATAADTVMAGQRAARFLGQDNPLAARSELAHFAGRNVGGWAGGTAAAYALGASGAGPMALIAADAYVMSKAGEKAADLLDNRAIYHQTDKSGTHWAFNGTAWSREGLADTTRDGVDNPTTTQIVASYEKARELNYQATNAAAALALKDAPAPQDPYRLPANATDRPSLSTADWMRDAADGQWHRQVKTGAGANDRGLYEQETASPQRAAELDAHAQQVIARNIANSPGAIAARYELAYHRSGWAADGWPLSEAVQRALPNPDALTASDGQQYRRDADGHWAGTSGAASGNVALELDSTRAILQPALAEHAQAVAAIGQSPPSPQEVQREQTLYRYRIVGTELQPQWREAIELATQRTRDAEGLVGDGAMQLQRGPGGIFGADSPIAHLQRGADGVERIAAITSTEDIRQALQEVRAQQTQPASPDQPALHLTTTARASDTSSNSDASSSNASSSPQLVLDLQARAQAARAAQVHQEREQLDRLAQEQHATQVREHIQQAQPEHEDTSRSEHAFQARAVLDIQSQAQQQRDHEERQVQERQAQTSQQREQQQREERDVQQRQVQERQAQDDQQREQETRQFQQAQQRDQEQRAQDAHRPEQQPLHARDAVQPDQESRVDQAAQQAHYPTQDAPLPLQAQDTQAQERQTHQGQQAIAQQTQAQQIPHGQSHAAEMAQPHTLGQQTQEERTHDTQHHAAQTVAIAHAAQAGPQRDAQVREQQPHTTQASPAEQGLPVQHSEEPAHAHLARMTNAPPALLQATVVAAEHNDAQHTPTSQTRVLEVPDDLAALSSSTGLAQASKPSLEASTAERSADLPESGSAARQRSSVSQTAEQATPAAPAPGSPESWQATLEKMRTLRVQLERDIEMETRVSEAREARIARGEQPFTEMELRDGYDPDGPSALRKIASSPKDAVSRPDAGATAAHTGSEQDELQQPKRRNVSKNPDVNDLIYAIDSKNDLAIDEALKRIANSASTHALIQRGREHLEANAMQEAQEQVSARQALAMEMPAEVQTSRGPVMVMTLPQFAHGPMMQGGPQGDGGGGGGGGG